MSAQNSDPGPGAQTFASCETPKPLLGKFIIVDQSNKVPQSTRCSSAVTSLALTAFLTGAPELAVAQSIQVDGSAAARSGAITHAQKMRRLFPDISAQTQATPAVIPQFEIDPDPSGTIATFQPNGPTITAKNAFFQNLGTNGRTCFTCHQPQDGWSLSAQHALDRFYADPDEPLFRLVDGATCPSADVSTYEKKQAAYRLLLEKGLIRVGLPMPSDGLEFQIVGVNDPYGCNTNPLTGLTSSTTGTVSVYRRILPAANLGFLSTIMWDGREPSLFSQAVDATLGHAEGTLTPSAAQQQQIVSFEGCTQALTPTLCANIPAAGGVFTAQISDDTGIDLSGAGGYGGPFALSKELAKFFIGINDPLGQNPTGVPFDAQIFDLYSNWRGRGVPGQGNERRQAIAPRGGTVQYRQDQHHRCHRTKRRAEPAEYLRLLQHVSRYAKHREPLGQGAIEYRRRGCRQKQPSGAGHWRIAGLHHLVYVGAARGEDVRGHRPGALADHWEVRRYRQGEGAHPARLSGACTIFSQWLGCDAERCRGFL